ncbi:hypothetical protein L5515_013939 [Caenorhabditis briggsae]|uniref:Rho GTPase-activating protein syd-1 n=1 Tax=Caenorhabditis briggsae TaxID=6238 RepID=A0AAE9EBZ1_CAEBR|nr:hypothetical protein L5515_013939 [Caenorhabditis briggsae]
MPYPSTFLYREEPSVSTTECCCCWLCRLLCCCSTVDNQTALRDRMNASQPPPGGGGRLPDEVYRKIKAVDQGQSTLTQSGIQGLSARTLDENQRGDLVFQLVEIIKKPGQSLGLYLREGNGKDRSDGVFVSRFGDNSELAKYGEVMRPGDEILTINNVEVSMMSIDDVVLILSIPRRLLLRIRFSKSMRHEVITSRSSERPVVVFHKYDDRRDSETNAPILSQPTSTANTWLGKKSRQQMEEMRNATTTSTMRAAHASTSSPRNHFAPRLVNGHSQPIGVPSASSASTSDHHYQRFASEPSDSVSRTARVPPPRLASATVRRTESFNSAPGVSSSAPMYTLPRSSTAVPPPDIIGSIPHSARDPLMRSDLPYDPLTGRLSSSVPTDPLLSRSLCSPILPRTLRQPNDSNKSNSLPRRRIMTGGRNVKWRNDVVSTSDLCGEESDGAISAPEYSSPPFSRLTQQQQFRLSNGSPGRTVNDIFSAAEYRNWAGPYDPRGMYGPYPPGQRTTRWSHTYGEQRAPRTSSLPGRTVLAQSLVGSPVLPRHPPPIVQDRPSAVFDRYHVSPLMNRRAPLRAAGPGINVDRLSVSSLTGILYVHILEGRGLKIPEKQKGLTEEMYCVLEVDEQHRARTGVSTIEQKFKWRETFHIDVVNATVSNFFVYSWHPQFRHKLCHKGSLKLLEAFVVDQLNDDRVFALNLEPRGQLIVRIGFHDLQAVFRRTVNPRLNGVFGVPLGRLVQRERRDTPIVLTRLIQEIEKRGVDLSGLYVLCGSVEKKKMLRAQLESNPLGTDLNAENIPDTNVIACLIKDFLRELPEPLISPQIHGMLLEAATVALPNDVQANRTLVLKIIDCLQLSAKNCLLLVLDHLSTILCSSPHNGLTPTRLSLIFAPLLFFCLDAISPYTTSPTSKMAAVRSLDMNQASSSLQMILSIWPSRVNSESGSDSPATSGTFPSPDQLECLNCRNGTCDCPQPGVLIYRDVAGHLLSNGAFCDYCAEGFSKNDDGECKKCDYSCPGKKFTNSDKVYTRIKLQNGVEMKSNYIENHLSTEAKSCSERNVQSCEALANICVLQNFEAGFSLNACGLLENIKRSFNPWQNAWDALANTDDSELEKENVIDHQYLFKDDSRFELFFARYDVNGTFDGFFTSETIPLLLCGDFLDPFAPFVFGRRFYKECKIKKEAYSDSFLERKLFEVYLKFTDEQGRPKLYPMHVLNSAIRVNGQLPNFANKDRNRWILTRRFYLVDDYTLQFDNSTRLLRFAAKIGINVVLQRDRDGYINPPYLTIEYDDTTEENLENSLEVMYHKDPSGYDQKLTICLSIVVPLSLFWSALCSYSWGRRQGKPSAVDASSILYFFVCEVSVLGDVFFIIFGLIAFWITFAYKSQTYASYNMLSEDQERSLFHYIISALVLKFFGLLFTMGALVFQETFFIDWERQKLKQTDEHGMPLSRDLNKSTEAEPVVVWRTYLIANEWNELQQYRKTSLALQIIMMTLLMEYFQIKNYALVEPGFERNSADSATTLSILLSTLAITVSLYLFLAFIQVFLRVLIVERIVTDPFHNFVDLCSVSNISVLSLTHSLYGYYIHGRSVHGKGDAGMSEMNEFLQRERNNLCGFRGLETGSELQTFIVNLPQMFRSKYDEISAISKQTTSGVVGHEAVTAKMNATVEAHSQMNSFLKKFVDHSISDIDYVVRDRPFLESLLDMEMSDTSITGSFTRDHVEIAYSRCFVYGNEWAWTSFECLGFTVFYIWSGSIYLAGAVVYVISHIIRMVFGYLSTNHLIKTSLVDQRFLV